MIQNLFRDNCNDCLEQTSHWSNSGLLAKKSITHKISPDIIHLDLNKDPYVFN